MKGRLFVSIGAMLVGLPGLLFAQAAQRPVDLNRRVFIDVNQAAPFAVLAELSSVIGTYLNPDTAMSTTPVTLRVWNVRARTALDALCDSAGCRWQLDGRTLRVTLTDPPPPPPRSAEFFARLRKPLEGTEWTFVRAPLRDVVAALSRAVGEQVVFEGADPQTSLTVNLVGVTPYRALFNVMVAMGWDMRRVAWEGVDNPSGPIVLRASGSEDPGIGPPSRQPSDRVYAMNEPGVTMPTVISETRPSYTREAMRAKIEGWVVLSAVVEPDGSVREVKVIRPLSPDLDAEAIRAAKRWQFEPGKKDGKAVPVLVSIELAFTLKR